MKPIDRSVKLLLAVLAAGVWGLLLHAMTESMTAVAADKSDHTKLAVDELTVKRINVIDESGRTRVVLSNSDRFPNPVVDGKEYPRTIKPAGLVFYKANGDEAGGVALAEVAGTRKNFLAFDYSNSEAVGLGMTEPAGGGFSAGINLLDRVPLDADIEKVGSVGKERIAISNENGNAEVVLRDANEQPRIRLFVDKAGMARIEIKGPDGKTVFTAP